MKPSYNITSLREQASKEQSWLTCKFCPNAYGPNCQQHMKGRKP